ncbi:hypothetical protein ACFFHJ_35695 [Planotetraspora thailandica]|uniref:hypothetical protein n=1 Tax=Planotetraspora thailandica TaxID=487172 RepID=UPI0019509648|nr:hypothetical protein [Planotetraspora thailandica]
MDEPEGLTFTEAFVLEETDGGAPLWEIAAAWTGDEDRERHVGAVPVLAETLTALARYGLVVVHAFPAWPVVEDEAVEISGDQLARAVAEVRNWLWPEAQAGPIIATITDAGGVWL